MGGALNRCSSTVIPNAVRVNDSYKTVSGLNIPDEFRIEVLPLSHENGQYSFKACTRFRIKYNSYIRIVIM